MPDKNNLLPLLAVILDSLEGEPGKDGKDGEIPTTGFNLKSPNGTLYKITISDLGVLTAVKIQ